jgi:hypothetical protein
MEYRQMPWERMDIVLPSGETPELTFSAIRMAAKDRDWKKFYGCLTSDARCEQLAYRARCVRDGVPDRLAITSPEKVVQRCKNCLELFDRYGLDWNSQSYEVAPSVINLNQFAVDAWDTISAPGASMFEESAVLSGLRIDGDNAIAEVHGNHNRHQNTSQDYIRFKKINERWLIDMSPWWFPWGPSFREYPVKKKRDIPYRSRRWIP